VLGRGGRLYGLGNATRVEPRELPSPARFGGWLGESWTFDCR
jgi:hypothetical protein